MKCHRHLFLCVFLLIGLSTGCNRAKTPSEVVRAAILAANEGRIAEFESYFTAEAQAAWRTAEATMRGNIKDALDEMTRNGSISRTDILREEVHGEGAKVHFKLYFKDGSTLEDDDTLILQQGQWKMTFE